MKRFLRLVRYIAVCAVLLWTLLPIVYLFMTSIKPGHLLLEVPPRFIFKPSFDEYKKVFVFGSYSIYLKNSIIVSFVSTIGAVILGTMTAFTLVNFGFRGKKALLFLILVTRMFPPVTTVIPVYLASTRLGLVDTKLGLILPYIAFQIPLIVWIMKDFIGQIPKEIQESATIDGCSTGHLFLEIILPLSTPGLVASGVLAFIYNWNEFLFALALTSLQAKTLPVALMAFTESEGMIQWGSVAVVGVVTLLPVLFFFLVLNKFLVKGLMAGAVKG